MRILTVHPGPNFSVEDVHAGWVEGFADLGCQVQAYNLHDRLNFYSQVGVQKDGEFIKALSKEEGVRMAAYGIKAACFEYQPDILFVVSGFFVPPEFLDVCRARGVKVVVLHTESPYEDRRQLGLAAHADLNVLNDPTNLETFQQVAPSEFVGHSYRPSVHYRRTAGPDEVSEFCFVATGYQSRIDFLEQVDFAGIDVALGGNWQQLTEQSPLRKHLCHDIDHCLANVETVELYSGALMSANLYRKEAQHQELSAGWACGPREIELAAVGTPFLREPRGESDELLPMLPTFTDPDDFGDKLRWWLAHEKERQEAADAAKAAVVDRTFTNAARGLLARLERL